MGSKLEPFKDEIIRLYNEGHSSLKLSRIYNSPANNICLMLNRWGIPTNKIYRTYPTNFDMWPYTDNGAYWLGFLLADGYINPNKMDKLVIELSHTDKAHLEKLAKFACGTYQIYDKPNRISPSHTTSTLSICSKSIIKSIEAMGWYEFKHGNNPQKLMNAIPPRLTHHLLRGFFDGDGSIGHREFSLVSPHKSVMDLLSDILVAPLGTKLIVRSNGLARRSANKYKDIYRIRTTSLKHIKNLYAYLYHDSQEYLDRKHIEFQNRIERGFNWKSKGDIWTQSEIS